MYSPLEQFEVLRFLDSVNVVNNNDTPAIFLHDIFNFLFKNTQEMDKIFKFFSNTTAEEVDYLNENFLNLMITVLSEENNREIFTILFNSLMYIYTEILLEIYNNEPLINYFDLFGVQQNIKIFLVQIILIFSELQNDEILFSWIITFLDEEVNTSHIDVSSIFFSILLLLSQLFFVNPNGYYFDMQFDFFVELQYLLTISETVDMNLTEYNLIINDLLIMAFTAFLGGSEINFDLNNFIQILNDLKLLSFYEQCFFLIDLLEELYLMESSYIIDELYIYHFMDLNLISNVGNLNNYNLKLLLNYLFNNLTITLFIIFAFMLLYNNIFFLQNFIIKIKIQLIISSLINFIKNLFNDLITTNIAKFYYFQLLFLLFLLLLVINLFGLLPYTFVLTAQFCFTFSCAFIYFFSLNVTGIYLHGIKILNLFFPSGAPIFIAPLLVIIEIISYFARVFSLSIRLFANITAGHILLKIIAWFIWSLYNYIFASIPGIIIICILWFLEFFISILQAYVFTILLCIYLTDVINLH